MWCRFCWRTAPRRSDLGCSSCALWVSRDCRKAASVNPRKSRVRVTSKPLGLEVVFLDGRSGRIDASSYPNQPLVESLLLALATRTNVQGGVQSPGSLYWYRQVILRLARFAQAHGYVVPAAELDSGVLYAFWQSTSGRMENASRRLLRATENLPKPHCVSEEVSAHLLSTPVSPPPAKNPLAPYSQSEVARLIEACKSAIHQQRVEREALAQHMAATANDESLRAQAIRDAATNLTTLVSTRKRGRAYRSAYQHALAILAPTPVDALPYRILIGLDSGIPAEGINTFRLSDITSLGPRTSSIVYDKNRALGKEQRVIARKGPWSTPSLIDEWVSATQLLREASPSDDLWLARHSRTPEIRPIRWAAGHRTRPKFITQFGLCDDSGAPMSLDLRRLRTTWNAMNARNWYGMLPTDPNRSVGVEGDHYLFRSQDEEVINLEIEAAFTSIRVKAAAQEINVVPEEDLFDLAAQTRDDGMADSGTNMDMFAAMCSNPFQSPFSRLGTLCDAAVWNCLVCPNALFLRSHLPNLIRLHEHMMRRWSEMPPSQWINVYAAAWVVLVERILPEFGTQELREARELLSTEAPLELLELNA